MLHTRIVLSPVMALIILSLMIDTAPGRSSDNPARVLSQAATIEEVTRAGDKAIREGDWTSAETHFREALRLAPTQGFWRIQLVLILGQQKKWKAAFAELEPLARNRAVDWMLTVNRKLPDGKVAFVNTGIFVDEQKGIPRYVKAIREKEKVDAVARDIQVKLDAFAKQQQLALVYDISKFKGLPFESGNTTDVTSEFIAYYNASEYVTEYYGTVYIYRGVDTFDYGTQIVVLNPEAVVYLDGKEFLSLPEKTFIGFKVPVGRYVLHMSWKGIRRMLDVEPNTTYYLRIEQAVYPNFYQMIAEVDEKGALQAIRKSYTLQEKKIKLKQFEPIRKNPN